MNDEARTVRVEIFGEEYTLRSPMDEDYTRACARHVDEAIRNAHLQAHVSEPQRAAILAALEITDQLFRLRAEKEASERRTAGRLAALEERIAEALE